MPISMLKIHNEMQELRKSGVDVTLKSYLETKMPEYSVEKLYHELGIELKGMTVESFFSTEETKWLFPEVIRDAIRKGLSRAPFYSKLVAVSANVKAKSVTMPHFEKANASMRPVAEGADISLGTITWGEKQVTLGKVAKGFAQTYESLMFCPIEVASLFFEDLGTQMGIDMDGLLIDVLLNGDQEDGSEAPLTIGAATANTLAYTDIVAAWLYMAMIGRQSQAMVTNAVDALTILNMDEFKKRSQGTTDKTLTLSTPLPTDQGLFVHPNVGAKKIGFVDPSRAFAQFTAMPLLIESDVVIRKQWKETFASQIVGFANIFADARLILDYSKATSGQGSLPIPWPTE